MQSFPEFTNPYCNLLLKEKKLGPILHQQNRTTKKGKSTAKK